MGEIIDSALGRITEMAQIIIYDYSEYKLAIAENRSERAKRKAEEASKNAGGALNQKPSMPLSPGEELGEINTKNETELQPKERIFEVQFNPSELAVNASALTIGKQSIEINGEKTETSPAGATMNLNVNLIFDKMNALDAFIMDTGMASIGGAFGTAKLSTQTLSVKPEVEALLAALRSEFTRDVKFCWKNFTFSGILQYVQVRYTMFSPSGHPIRATIAMRLKREATIEDEWVECFDTAFSGEGGQTIGRTQGSGIVNL